MIKHYMISGAILFLAALAFFNAGCKTLPSIPSWPDIPAMTNAAPGQAEAQWQDDLDLSTVRWHGPDIRQWPITADLTASASRGEIMLHTELLKGRAKTGLANTTGNPWAVVMGSDGQWHGYTFEWIDYSRKSRSLWKAFDRGHGAPSVCTNARVRGAEFYVAVATVSRGTCKPNGNERTPFRKVVVP